MRPALLALPFLSLALGGVIASCGGSSDPQPSSPGAAGAAGAATGGSGKGGAGGATAGSGGAGDAAGTGGTDPGPGGASGTSGAAGAAAGGTAGTGPGGAGSAVGGTAGAGGMGAAGGGGTASEGDAVGVTITEIAIFQGTKRPVMQAGAPITSNIPIVANRGGVLRVYVATDASFPGGSVTARLTLGNTVIEDTKAPPDAASVEGLLSTTYNFDLPTGELGAGQIPYRVELKQANPSGVFAGARYPATGSENLPVVSGGAKLRVTIVPVQYNFDGSGRLPDTSPAALKAYHDAFLSIYPVPEVEITVHAVFPWNQKITAAGAGWDPILSAIDQLRATDAPPGDVYYYGAFEPAATFDAFCGNSCILGLGHVAGLSEPAFRSCVGVGYTGADSYDTAVHEIGHNHGRDHADCGGADGIDPIAPTDAQIVSWGYNILTKTLMDPKRKGNKTSGGPFYWTDFMGYCANNWLSDYTFRGLFNRGKNVNPHDMHYPPHMLDRTYPRATLTGGKVTWLEAMPLHVPPQGTQVQVTLVADDGSRSVVTGHYYPFDHLDGGTLLLDPEIAHLGKVLIDAGGKRYETQL